MAGYPGKLKWRARLRSALFDCVAAVHTQFFDEPVLAFQTVWFWSLLRLEKCCLPLRALQDGWATRQLTGRNLECATSFLSNFELFLKIAHISPQQMSRHKHVVTPLRASQRISRFRNLHNEVASACLRGLGGRSSFAHYDAELLL